MSSTTSQNGPSQPVVVGVGEVLWDQFYDAHGQLTSQQFGGAPANFAVHSSMLGADARILGAVGRDDLGDQARQILSERDVDTHCLQIIDKPTGSVEIRVDSQGVASYQFRADCAWDQLQWDRACEHLVNNADLICFGSLGQRSPTSRRTIQQLMRTVKPETIRLFDINLRPPFVDAEVIKNSLLNADVLKLNETELPVLAGQWKLTGDSEAMLKQLASQFALDAIIFTEGARGATYWSPDEVVQVESHSVNVQDTVGAGDSFTACVAWGLLADQPIRQVMEWASRVAAFVCSQVGATPRLPAELTTLS